MAISKTFGFWLVNPFNKSSSEDILRLKTEIEENFQDNDLFRETTALLLEQIADSPSMGESSFIHIFEQIFEILRDPDEMKSFIGGVNDLLMKTYWEELGDHKWHHLIGLYANVYEMCTGSIDKCLVGLKEEGPILVPRKDFSEVLRASKIRERGSEDLKRLRYTSRLEAIQNMILSVVIRDESIYKLIAHDEIKPKRSMYLENKGRDRRFSDSFIKKRLSEISESNRTISNPTFIEVEEEGILSLLVVPLFNCRDEEVIVTRASTTDGSDFYAIINLDQSSIISLFNWLEFEGSVKGSSSYLHGFIVDILYRIIVREKLFSSFGKVKVPYKVIDRNDEADMIASLLSNFLSNVGEIEVVMMRG